MSDVASRLARLSPEKQALLARQLRAAGTEAAGSESLAIVGIGCRFPGGGDSAQAFWRVLIEGVDAVTEVPADRWPADAYFDPDPARPGRMNTRWGAWLERVDEFDTQFFGLAPRETAKMDPQQRLVLEVCWEAFEDAGETFERLAGSRTGVFVGTHVNDYAFMTFGRSAPIDAYDSTGTAHSIVANRVSYLLDLHGPSLAVDTACSSSLVAVHLACQALRRRECDMAVACGVNLMLSPLWGLALAKLGMLSSDGRCRTFDARANGIVRGEGCGAVVLKRLADAEAAGDSVWAVVRGTATNQDGRTNGLTAPNGLSQQTVVRAALEDARVEPAEVGAIEAHGTGTPLGDPIEVEALAEVLGRGDAAANPCVLGSVKTNIGHLEGAAGIAGLIKLALCLHHERLPGIVHFESPNPLLPLAGTRFVLPSEARPWPRGSRRRLGGVSAFGFGGTNAHVVVEEAPVPAPHQPAPAGPCVLVVSARTPEALRRRAEHWSEWLLGEGAGEPLADVCFTAWTRRSRHEHGLSVAGATREEVAARLAAGAQGAAGPGVVRVRRAGGRRPGLAFVFTGQGTQWPGMARGLIADEPAARQSLEECDAAIRRHAAWSLLEELDRPAQSSRLASTEIAQPAVFAIQVALAAWWRSLGIVPDAVVGHSMGEVAAAHVAGVLTLDEAARVIVHRARLMEPTRGSGRMLAVELPVEQAAALARERAVSVAAVNSPVACVLSGDPGALAAVQAELERSGVAQRWLPVEYAFHSTQMESIGAELASVLGRVERLPAKLRIASTVTGAWASDSDFEAGYWSRNVREPVRFRDAADILAQAGYSTFVELGPHPALTRPLQQCAAAREDAPGVSVLACLSRDADTRASLRSVLGGLHLLGHAVDARVLWTASPRLVRLPPYPWQRERFAIPHGEAPATPLALAGGAPADPLLGGRLPTAIETYQQDVSAERPDWLGDHRVFGKVLFPAAAMLGAAWAAGARSLGSRDVQVEDLAIRGPLVVPEGGFKRVQVTATAEGDARRVRVFSAATEDGAEWEEHASARVRRADGDGGARAPAADAGAAGVPVEGEAFYARLAALGAGFGPRFRGIRSLTYGSGRATADVPVPGGGSARRPFQDPPLVDACLQVAAAALLDQQAQDGLLLLPVAIERAWCAPAEGATLRVEAVARGLERLAGEGVVVDVRGTDASGACVIALDGLHLRPSRAGQLASDGVSLSGVEWVAAPLSAPPPPRHVDPAARWLLLADELGVGDALAAKLVERGERVERAGASPDRERLRPWLDELLASGGPWLGIVAFFAPGDATAARDARELQQAAMEGLGRALALMQVLAGREERPLPRLWLVSRGACAASVGDEVAALASAALGGLVRVAALEHPELRAVRVDLDPAPHVAGAEALAAELVADDDELEVAHRHGERLVPRVRLVPPPRPPVAASNARLERGAARVLEELSWVETPRRAPGPGEVEIRVLAAALNFRDVLNALGLYPGAEIPLGNECVGEIVAVGPDVADLSVADLVIAVAFASIADHVTTPASMVVRKPAALSIPGAATLPIAFLTAHYALHELGRLRPGDRVLVHAGAGGVGLAAVQLALRAGATVYATAGSEEKRAFLRGLGLAGVMDSRSVAFADELAAATQRRGVDVVLNCLSGDFIPRSLDALAPGGRFLELGKRGIWDAADVARRRPDVAYHVVYLGEVCEAEPQRVGGWLAALVDDVGRGRLTPLTHRVFPRSEAVEAFRHMAQARHVGKVVLQIAQAPVVRPEGLVRRGTTQLITGGLGGVGLALAEWLAAQGASALALIGRTRPSPEAEAALARLRDGGTRVEVFPADVADRGALAHVLDRIDAELPSLAGVWHAAGVIADATLRQQDEEHFARVLAPKLAGAWNLHALTRERRLDAFVLFSSVSSLVGWPGQANYASANAFLDGLAHHRRQLGLPALSINWGTWAGVGMAAGLGRSDQERLGRRGLSWMEPARALGALDAAARAGAAQLAVAALDYAAFADGGCAAGTRRLLHDMAAPAPRIAAGEGRDSTAPDLGREIAAAPASRRRALVAARVREQALRTLGLAADFPLDARQGLRDVGLDSLMAVELRNALQQLAGRPLPSTLLFDFPTVESLSGYLLDALGGERAAPAAPAPVERGSGSEISDEEAEALLRAELANLRPQGGERG